MTKPADDVSINIQNYKRIFSPTVLEGLLPLERSDLFFDALLGDSSEGAYDIRLAFIGRHYDRLEFELQLHQRRGKCLACNLTYGLPKVFQRHPIINLKQIVQKINNLLEGQQRCGEWRLGRTKEISRELHAIPLTIALE
jgi:hypothetical protein